MVLTNEAGAQPLSWVASRTVEASGINCPVRILEGHFGATRDIVVSPNHRILIQHPCLEMFFGEPSVLVWAKNLTRGPGAEWDTGFDKITYVHVLFDQHYTLRTSGLCSESYHPGPETLTSADRFTKAHLHRTFPALSADPMAYGPSAYMTLKSREISPILQAIHAGSPFVELTA
jgi:hypothetical protein